MKFASEIENFKRKLEIFKRSSEIDFFQDSGPLGMENPRTVKVAQKYLVDVSDSFLFFPFWGRGGESEASGGRGLLKITERGGVSPGEGGGGPRGRGAGRVSAGNWGAKFFFFAAEIPAKSRSKVGFGHPRKEGQN